MEDTLFTEEQLYPAKTPPIKKKTREESRKQYLEIHQQLMEIAGLLRMGIKQQNAKAKKSKEKTIAKNKKK